MCMRMLTEQTGIQIKMHCVTIEDLVPQGHFLRRPETSPSVVRKCNGQAFL